MFTYSSNLTDTVPYSVCLRLDFFVLFTQLFIFGSLVYLYELLFHNLTTSEFLISHYVNMLVCQGGEEVGMPIYYWSGPSRGGRNLSVGHAAGAAQSPAHPSHKNT